MVDSGWNSLKIRRFHVISADQIDMIYGPVGVLPTRPTDHFTTPTCTRGEIMPQEPISAIGPRPVEAVVYEFVASGILRIDADGRIWRVKDRRQRTGQLCVPRRAESRLPLGYLQVRILVGGRLYHVGAHRLVWWHFNEPIPDGMVINHLNGIKWDNRPVNLECVTPSENMSHAYRTGLKDQRGQKNPAAKLTDRQVIEIRLLYAQGGITQQAISERYGVRFQHVSRIVKGQRRASQLGPILSGDLRYGGEKDPVTGRFVATKDVDLSLSDSHGGDPAEWPKDLRVRELPTVAVQA
jgi:hypothetical protein